MYCPKCTLEIKGEDQVTCPICSEPLIESSVENIEQPTSEDLKLQELIADIDASVSGSDDQSSSQDIPDSEVEDASVPGPDYKLEMDDKMPEPELEPEIKPFNSEGEDTGSAPESDESGDEFSIDLEKEFSLDDEMTDGELSSDQGEDNFYDLEKELGLVDEKMKSIDEEPSSIDFDKLALTEEEKSFALDDAVEDDGSDDAAETDSKEDLDRTLEELDPIKDMEKSQKKSSSFGLIAVLVILIIVCGIAYTKFKPEIESFIKSDPAKIAKDEQLKEKFGPKADKQVQKEVVEEKVPVDIKVPEQPVVVAVEQPVEKAVAEKVEEIIEAKEVKVPPEPVVEKVEEIIEAKEVKVSPESVVEKVEEIIEVKEVKVSPKPVVEKVEAKEVKALPKSVKKEVAVPAKPSVTYSIHAGSFRKSKLAQNDVNRFNKLGYNAYIERVNLGDKGIWYRVKIGLYNTRAEALKAEKEFLGKVKAQTRVIRNK